MTEKFLQYFKDMSVIKSNAQQAFSGLAIPSFIRDWFIMRYSDSDGSVNLSLMLDKLNRYMPGKSQWNNIMDKLIEGNQVKILARISVNIDIKTGVIAFNLPDYDITSKSTFIEKKVWDEVKSKILTGGEAWGVLTLSYKPITSKESKICLEGFNAFQPYTADLKYYKNARKNFTLNEWLSVLLGGFDYDANGFTEEEKLSVIRRMLIFVENRINLIELAPKGTGKSYMFSNISKYGWLISGGVLTRAKLFYDMNSKQEGLINRYDFVAIDEISTIKIPDADEMKGALKGYLESGKYTVGSKAGSALSGMIFLGNIDSNMFNTDLPMFSELPAIFKDSALLDRFHGFIEGWENPRMREEMKMKGASLNSEYFSEIMHQLRQDITYSAIVDAMLKIDNNADTRDVTAIKKICTAYVKLLFPHWQSVKDVDKAEFKTYCLLPALKMRGVIRKQLNIIDSEYKTREVLGISMVGDDEKPDLPPVNPPDFPNGDFPDNPPADEKDATENTDTTTGTNETVTTEVEETETNDETCETTEKVRVAETL